MKQIKQYISELLKSLVSIKNVIFVIMVIAGFIPAVFLYVGILRNYEKKAVEISTTPTCPQQ